MFFSVLEWNKYIPEWKRHKLPWIKERHIIAEISLWDKYHSEIKWADFKTSRKGKPGFCFGKRIGYFWRKINSFVEDIQSGKILHFQFQKKYRDKTSATIDTNYFSTGVTSNTQKKLSMNLRTD